jgi:hypothetical protein
MKAEDLVGTWRLRSWKNVGSDGSEVYPLGEQPRGYIFYNHDGYMSVEIMAEGRMPYQQPDAFGRHFARAIRGDQHIPVLHRALRATPRPGHRDPPHRGLLVSELDRQRPGAFRQA